MVLEERQSNFPNKFIKGPNIDTMHVHKKHTNGLYISYEQAKCLKDKKKKNLIQNEDPKNGVEISNQLLQLHLDVGTQLR